VRANKQVVDGLLGQLKLAQDKAADHKRQAQESDLFAAGHRREAAGCDEQAAQLRELLRFADPENAATYADPPGRSADQYSERAGVLAGIREMVDFLEAHPAIPLTGLKDFQISSRGATPGLADEMEVDRIAREMGVPSGREAPNMHYYARRGFGPETRDRYRCGRAVVLQAVSCDRTDMDWKEGDPYPEWWPQAAAAESEAASAPEEPLEGFRAAGQPVDAEVDYDELALAVQASQDEYADTVDDDLCGAKAVDPQGKTGRCALPTGHLEQAPEPLAYHHDPAFGSWVEPGAGGGDLDKRVEAVTEPEVEG
jgi:hypothetical protein